MRWGFALVAMCCAFDAADSRVVSPLELPLVTQGPGPAPGAVLAVGDRSPRLVLAQRAIDREWSVVGDSSVAGLHVEGMKSEFGGAALSAVVPGTGQLYGGSATGYAYVAVEAAGWLSYFLLRDSGQDLSVQSELVAGVPEDTASAWSFARWEASGGNADPLRALYTADPDAFYHAIESDQLAAGWSGPEARNEYGDLRSRSATRLEQARWTTGAIWVNHLIAAFDALRVVRMRNLELGGNVQLKARGSWQHGRPAMMVSLVRKF